MGYRLYLRVRKWSSDRVVTYLLSHSASVTELGIQPMLTLDLGFGGPYAPGQDLGSCSIWESPLFCSSLSSVALPLLSGVFQPRFS